jgi:hypothetical protein
VGGATKEEEKRKKMLGTEKKQKKIKAKHVRETTVDSPRVL